MKALKFQMEPIDVSFSVCSELSSSLVVWNCSSTYNIWKLFKHGKKVFNEYISQLKIFDTNKLEKNVLQQLQINEPKIEVGQADENKFKNEFENEMKVEPTYEVEKKEKEKETKTETDSCSINIPIGWGIATLSW
jgi:hypothetical protein